MLGIPIRIAILEASHWHVPLYLPGFRRNDVRVVAISDRRHAAGPALAARLGCTSYADHRVLLDAEAVDFAFVFGRHVDMAGIAADLIDHGVPFAIEKPCATHASDVARLRRRAEDRGLYVAVPFILRLAPVMDALRSALGALPARFQHLDLRFIAGPLSRYEAIGDAWMLDSSVAGGGCTINIGTHLIDLFLLLANEPVMTVSAHMSYGTPGASVEDYSNVVLTSASGIIGSIVTGYTYAGVPGDQRDFALAFALRDRYVRTHGGTLRATLHGCPAGEVSNYPVSFDLDSYYPVFVDRVLADFRAGRHPVAGLREAEAVLTIVDAAYASARSGTQSVLHAEPATSA